MSFKKTFQNKVIALKYIRKTKINKKKEKRK